MSRTTRNGRNVTIVDNGENDRQTVSPAELQSSEDAIASARGLVYGVIISSFVWLSLFLVCAAVVGLIFVLERK